MTETRKMRTTSIQVKVPSHYDFLDTQFNLIRYVIPERLNNDSVRFKTIYADVRDAVSYPHLVFTHDTIDGDEVDAVYVLYPKDVEASSITYSRIENGVMQAGQLDFATLVEYCGFHVLVKLLMASFFDQPNQEMFVGRAGKNYIYSYGWTSKKYGTETHICVDLKLKGETEPNEIWQVFSIINNAAKFVEKSDPSLVSKRKFGGLYAFVPSSSGNNQYMRQLRRKEVGNFAGKVFEQEGWGKHPVQLSHHNLNRLQQSRGYIVHKFQDDFLEYLEDLGFETNYVFRDFIPFDAKEIKDKLPFEKVAKIFVCDVRHNRDGIPTEYYVELLRNLPYEVKKKENISTFGDKVTFEIVERTQLKKGVPTILLQDATIGDYKEDGFLKEDFPDPYKEIYNNSDYRKIPKQFVNVNPHTNMDVEDEEEKPKDIETYLSYPKLTLENNVDMQLKVALFQLHLKLLVINDMDVSGHLYGFESEQNALFGNYGFIRRKTYTNKGNFTTLLYVKDNKLCFVDLQSPDGKLALKNNFGLSIKSISQKIDARHQRKNSEITEDVGSLRNYDVIISKDGLIVEIENINETVLHDYQELAKRQKEWKEVRPIAEFKLAKKYKDEDIGEDLSDLIKKYDKELTLIGYEGTDSISWKTLKKDFKERIENIISVRRLQRLYSEIGMFLGERTKELKVSEGIWYTEDDLTYFVGSAQPERRKQHRANLLRRFCLLSDSDGGDFNIKLFLAAMGVQFIKHNEFTVLPYFYNLIDIYVENVLYWETENLPIDE